MAYNETVITVVGNLTADPELRFTPSGAPVTNFVIASTPRFFDRQANEFKDAETLFVRCSLWREAAENVCESLTKGTRVIAQGRLKARSYEDREGNQRTSWELDVDEVGPSLRYATAKVERQAARQGGQGGFGGNQGGGNFGGGQPSGGYGGGQGGSFGGGPQQDPWGGQPSQGGGWDAGNDEPPF